MIVGILTDAKLAGEDQVLVTCLQASQGLIWVGTNTGHILALPVPVSIIGRQSALNASPD